MTVLSGVLPFIRSCMTTDCGLSVSCWQGVASSAGGADGVGEDHCHGKILLTYSPTKGKIQLGATPASLSSPWRVLKINCLFERTSSYDLSFARRGVFHLHRTLQV